MDIITGNVGWIEVICGPMFSGKSEELIRRLRRAMIARKRVEVFKPTIDTRYSDDEIVSHGDLRMHSQVVASASDTSGPPPIPSTQSRTIANAGIAATTAPKPTRLATLSTGRTAALAAAFFHLGSNHLAL